MTTKFSKHTRRRATPAWCKPGMFPMPVAGPIRPPGLPPKNELLVHVYTPRPPTDEHPFSYWNEIHQVHWDADYGFWILEQTTYGYTIEIVIQPEQYTDYYMVEIYWMFNGYPVGGCTWEHILFRPLMTLDIMLPPATFYTYSGLYIPLEIHITE